jgi:hypothetical protein
VTTAIGRNQNRPQDENFLTVDEWVQSLNPCQDMKEQNDLKVKPEGKILGQLS